MAETQQRRGTFAMVMLILAPLLLTMYVAGYGVFRTRCGVQSIFFGRQFSISVRTDDRVKLSFYYLFYPMMLVDRQLTGLRFASYEPLWPAGGDRG